MKIKVEQGQTGYDVVGEYIYRFWKSYGHQDTVICQIGSSYDGIKYEIRNEVASPCSIGDIEFLYDWWEGEKYINIIGICYLSEIDPYGGIFDKDGIAISCDTCTNRGKYGSCTLNSSAVCWEYEKWERDV